MEEYKYQLDYNLVDGTVSLEADTIEDLNQMIKDTGLDNGETLRQYYDRVLKPKNPQPLNLNENGDVNAVIELEEDNE